MKLVSRQRSLYILAIGTEACWLYLLLTFLNRFVAAEQFNVPALLAVYPLAFVVVVFIKTLTLHKIARESLIWFFCLLATALIIKTQLFALVEWLSADWLLSLPRAFVAVFWGIRPELLAAAIVFLLWWLGRRLANLKMDFANMLSEFQFGLVVLLIVVFVSTQLSLIPNSVSVPATLTFFLLSLTGLFLTHTAETSAGKDNGNWSGLLSAAIGGILLLGLLLNAVVTPELLQLAVSGVAWIFEQIFRGLAFLFSLIPMPESTAPPPLPPPGPDPSETVFKLWEMPEWLRNIFNLGYGILWLGLIVLAIWRISSQILSWLKKKLAKTAEAEFQAMPGAFRADLLGLLRWLLAKLLGIKSKLRPVRATAPVPPEIESVREIYRRLLRWATDARLPRQISQTPYEYLDTLVISLPQFQADLAFITRQYVQARYSTVLPDNDELSELKRSWRRLSQHNQEVGP